MDEIPNRLRAHYESQRLSAEAQQRILAAGAAKRSQRSRRTWWFAMAAAVVVALGIVYGYGNYTRQQRRMNVESAVAQFFETHNFQLDQVSQNSAQLLNWLRERGAPTQMRIPDVIAGLRGVGCKVLATSGGEVYILCLNAASRLPSPGTLSAADHPRATPTVVHLVLYRLPQRWIGPALNGGAVHQHGDWTFLFSAQGDYGFIIASTIERGELENLLAARVAARLGPTRIASRAEGTALD